MAVKRSACANAASPCFASSRLAMNVLAQAVRVFSTGSTEIPAAADSSGRSCSSGSPSGAEARRFRIRVRASATE
jgi:hypothetical protein